MNKGVLAVTAVAVCVFLVLVVGRYPFYTAVPVDPDWEVKAPATIPPGAVTVRFTGTTTLLFSDGTTEWMVDGWFSRHGLWQLGVGKIGPDSAAVSAGLAANEVDKLAAVIPVHSHFDHAMDAPEVARQTGAILMGSESTANIGRGWGLPEAQIRVLENRAPVAIGAFTLTAIESQHFQFPDPEIRAQALANPSIEAPLVPPVKMLDYRVGKPYVFHVQHPKGSFAIFGSAGFEPGALQDYAADVVFLGVGGLGSQTAQYRENYWRESVGAMQPTRVIPVHYDSLTATLQGPFVGQSAILSVLSSGADNTLHFLRSKAEENAAISLSTLPRYKEIVLFE